MPLEESDHVLVIHVYSLAEYCVTAD